MAATLAVSRGRGPKEVGRVGGERSEDGDGCAVAMGRAQCPRTVEGQTIWEDGRRLGLALGRRGRRLRQGQLSHKVQITSPLFALKLVPEQ